MHPKLVIFDVDGLLLDTEIVWYQAWQEIGKKHGVSDLGKTIFLNCVGRNGQESKEIVLQELNKYSLSLDIMDEVSIYGRSILDNHIDVKKGAFELLEKLDQLKIKKAVATATSRELTVERLTRLNLIDYFDYLICGNEVNKRKPDPEIYLKVLEHFQIDSQEAFVLEDSFVGVEAANRANIPCIMVPDLAKATKKQEQETIAIVDSLVEVMEMFK